MADRHPIPDRPNLPLDERVAHLEVMLARLWDQVWWMQLTPKQRADYERQGHTAPITAFYEQG